MKRTLLIGIGNTGRGDDGLGWVFADRLQGDERFDIEYRYQLQVEDAELISAYEEVWFVDASHRRIRQGFECIRVHGEGQFEYTTHALHPEAVVLLCRELYSSLPKAMVLGISGEDFELGKGLSAAGKRHLNKALVYFDQAVQCPV